MRNLVLCFDGTGNQFGTQNTNVVRLCETLVRDPERQILWYDPGVGTMGDARMITKVGKWFSRILGGAVGSGLRGNVEEAHGFLAEHWRPEDRVFLFGFSRGAYTARALAGLLTMYGLIESGNENLFPYVWGMFARWGSDGGAARNEKFRVADAFARTFCRRVTVHFVGVWDTVSSVGWFWDPLALPYTRSNPDVEHIRHAVSIDERRAFFRQNLVTENDRRRDQDLKEVWFAGVHSDVGGGYPESEGGLSKIALEWMLREAEACGLITDTHRKAAAISGPGGSAPPDPNAPIHESLTPLWWPLELLPRLRWGGKGRSPRIRVNFFRRRIIPADATRHFTVETRRKSGSYAPPNLPPTGPVEH